MSTQILSPVPLQDYADWLIGQLEGFTDAGDGATSRDALIAAFRAYAVHADQIDPVLAQVVDFVGQVYGKTLSVGQVDTTVIPDVAGTITAAYAVGDKFVLGGDGTGAYLLVTAVTGTPAGPDTMVWGNAGKGYSAATDGAVFTYVPKNPASPGAGAVIGGVTPATVNTNEVKLLTDVQAAL